MDPTRNIPISKHAYIDTYRQVLMNHGLPIALGRLEFRILLCLALQIGRPVSIRDLIYFAWGETQSTSKDELYVYISRLRKKLARGKAQQNQLISIQGFGYLLATEEESLQSTP